MRWSVLILMLICLPAGAESADLPAKWGKSREGLNPENRAAEEARVKAFVRDLLGDEGSAPPTLPSAPPTETATAR